MSTKLVDSEFLDNGLTTIADSIRAKAGGTDSMAFPDGFVSKINSIKNTGDIVLSSLNKDTVWGGIKTISVTMTHTANSKTIVVTINANNTTLPVFTSIKHFTMWTPASIYAYWHTGGYADKATYQIKSSWQENTPSRYAENYAPTFFVSSSDTSTLRFRITDITNPSSYNFNGSYVFDAPTANTFLEVIGE